MEEARRLCMWGEEEEEHQESEEQAHVHMPLITTHKYESTLVPGLGLPAPGI